jgi:hypothetical protein
VLLERELAAGEINIAQLRSAFCAVPINFSRTSFGSRPSSNAARPKHHEIGRRTVLPRAVAHASFELSSTRFAASPAGPWQTHLARSQRNRMQRASRLSASSSPIGFAVTADVQQGLHEHSDHSVLAGASRSSPRDCLITAA